MSAPRFIICLRTTHFDEHDEVIPCEANTIEEARLKGEKEMNALLGEDLTVQTLDDWFIDNLAPGMKIGAP